MLKASGVSGDARADANGHGSGNCCRGFSSHQCLDAWFAADDSAIGPDSTNDYDNDDHNHRQCLDAGCSAAASATTGSAAARDRDTNSIGTTQHHRTDDD